MVKTGINRNLMKFSPSGWGWSDWRPFFSYMKSPTRCSLNMLPGNLTGFPTKSNKKWWKTPHQNGENLQTNSTIHSRWMLNLRQFEEKSLPPTPPIFTQTTCPKKIYQSFSSAVPETPKKPCIPATHSDHKQRWWRDSRRVQHLGRQLSQHP